MAPQPSLVAAVGSPCTPTRSQDPHPTLTTCPSSEPTSPYATGIAFLLIPYHTHYTRSVPSIG
eukprot:3132012-Rhodomonas_salina.1